MAGRKMAVLVLSEAERSELMLLSARRKTGQALALRARIVLECARGLENREVAARLRLAKGTVGKWRRRFVEHRLDGLRDDPRSGAPRTIEDADIEAVIVKTLESMPENATHWSSRGMAKASGISVSFCATHLACLRPPAAQDRDVQAFDGSGLCCQSPRCCRALRLAARARRRALRR